MLDAGPSSGAIPLNRAMIHGGVSDLDAKELELYADEGVRVFLAAYAAT